MPSPINSTLCVMVILASVGLLALVTMAESTTPVPIRFARGAASAEVAGGVPRGSQALYSINARAGQQMSLSLTSVEDNAVFQVYVPGAKPALRDGTLVIDGETLRGAGETDDASLWSGQLPRSGIYLIVVGATRGGTEFRLKVSIR